MLPLIPIIGTIAVAGLACLAARSQDQVDEARHRRATAEEEARAFARMTAEKESWRDRERIEELRPGFEAAIQSVEAFDPSCARRLYRIGAEVGLDLGVR